MNELIINWTSEYKFNDLFTHAEVIAGLEQQN